MTDLQREISTNAANITYEKLPTLFARDTQVYQLFLNLVWNGIKFRRDEPPAIHISARQEKTEWLFSVRDNGIGIDPEHSTHIFDLFQRLHDHSDIPGSGIGLAVCKRVVENHGGRIWVESLPGMGSTFHFTLLASDMNSYPSLLGGTTAPSHPTPKGKARHGS
jgi:two-component system, chemotaxis family, sensor kinase Cph1